MLVTEPVHDFVQTSVTLSSDETMPAVAALYERMMQEAADFVKDAGYALDDVTFLRYADMRYLGQEHTVRISIGDLDRAEIEDRFHEGHERAYAFRLPDNQIQFVNFLVSAKVALPVAETAPYQPHGGGQEPLKGERDVMFEEGWLSTRIYDRLAIPVGEPIDGPAIVEEPSSTTVIHPGQTATVDRFGNLVIDTGV
jgi:N-methylhydantoinase A